MSTNGALDERVMRRLKLRELHILTTVARAGSMGKAAAQLGLPSPRCRKRSPKWSTLGIPLRSHREGVEPTLWSRLAQMDCRSVRRPAPRPAEIEFLPIRPAAKFGRLNW
jgi:hypothetical protein